jgi:hypothetical protein
MFVLDYLATAKSRHRLYSYSKSNRQEGRAFVASSDDSREDPKLGMFALDCPATAESRKRLLDIL